ncbi:Latrophilin-like protein LAT-2 [Holothuria leucospilota]|uniref:Latrophilin-like protein LAT-2 n=1 Tax=Holothuria leucospilota TaxID=206669 RepID=A0A9Q1CCZ0_HOLLE|nr:Latrophilin-like protein LAT-2 [Holothuria leucospilota]
MFRNMLFLHMCCFCFFLAEVSKCGFNDGCINYTEICIDEENGVRCDCAASYYRDSKGICIPDECKDNSLSISCGDGLIDIRNTRSNFRPMYTVYCGEKSIQNYSAPCLSNQELQNLINKCNNKPLCEIPGRTGLDGICISYLNFACVFKCGLNDHCNKTTEICLEENDEVKCKCAEGYNESKAGVCIETMQTCQEDALYYNGILLSFPQTKTLKTAHSYEMCPSTSSYPNSSLARRDCTATAWLEPVVRECFNELTLNHQFDVLTKINVTENNVQTVAKTLEIASSQGHFITQKEVASLITSLNSVVQVNSPSQKVTDSVVGVVNNVMKLQKNVIDNTEEINSVVVLLEDQVAHVLKSGQNYTRVSSNLEVGAYQVPRVSLQTNYTFVFNLLEEPSDLVNDSCNYRKTYLTLPNSVLTLIDKIHPNASTVPISFMAFQDASLFQTSNVTSEQMSSSLSNEYIDSHVLAVKIEVDDTVIRELPTNDTVVARFPVPINSDISKEEHTNVEYACVKWEGVSNGPKSRWSKKGCTTEPSSEGEILCSCNQLTSFAVLVKVRNDMIETSLLITFHVITKVGCFLSVICLSVTIMVILFKRSIRTNKQTKIHLNLCVALFAFYLTFLAGIDKSNDCLGCKVSATLIQFFCLSAMAWMSVEACLFYNFFWKLRRTIPKNMFPLSMVIAWGGPFVVSMSCAGLNKNACYNDYCFLHGRNLLIFGFLLEMLVMFLFNFTVFMLITYRLTCRRILIIHQQSLFTEVYLRVKRIYGFWLLLGISWIFGFLSAVDGPINVVFQMMFGLCMTLQGVGIFIVLILNNPEIREKVAKITYSRKSEVPSTVQST